MTWMLTSTGAMFTLDFIEPQNVSILDIAHHLAQINRFTGACSRPYSVAEHSLLVCDIVHHAMPGASPSVLLAALLHDAHEAYTTDLSSPMKAMLGARWHEVEFRVEHAVRRRFNVLAAAASAAEIIKWADATALITERVQLLPPGGPQWAVSVDHAPLDWIDLSTRAAFTWLDWRQAFLDRFAELQFALQEQQRIHAQKEITR